MISDGQMINKPVYFGNVQLHAFVLIEFFFILETVTQLGFWFNTKAKVCLNPLVRLRRIKDLKRDANAEIASEDLFEMIFTRH